MIAKHKSQVRSRGVYPLLTGLLTVLLVLSCDINKLTDAVDDFKVVISLEPIRTSVSGQFVDVSTGDLIEEDITVSFKGPDNGQVVDIFSEPLEDLTIEEGLMTFGFRNEQIPSSNNPLKIRVVADSYAFMANSKNLVIDREGNHQFVIYLRRNRAFINGAWEAEVNGKTDNGGTISEDVIVESPNHMGTNGGVKISLSAGTRITDKDGNALRGDIYARVIHYDLMSDMVQKLLSIYPVEDANTTFVPVVYHNLGVSDQQGQIAASLSEEMQVFARISPQIINPRTNQPYQAGDQVTIFSYHEEEGNWVAEGIAEVAKNGDGQYLQILYETDHFSQWMAGTAVPVCQEGSLLNIDWQGARRNLELKIVPNSDITGPKSVFIPASADQFHLPEDVASQIPNDIGAKLLVVTAFGEIQIGPSSIGLCGQEHDVTVPLEEVIDGTITMELACPSPSENVILDNLPTTAIYYRQMGITPANWYRIDNLIDWEIDEKENYLTGGSIEVQGFTIDASYLLKTVYDGETYETSITLSSSDPNFTLNNDGTFNYTYLLEVEGDLCN